MEKMVVPSNKFWQGRRVFLTGHTGFKGSWLAVWLISMGSIVKGFSLPPSRHSLFNMIDQNLDFESQIGDIRDQELLSDAMIDFKPEVVIHLAAQPLVLESYVHPRETYEVNIMGTVNLLEAIRQCPSVRSVVIVTTDKCYENQEWPWGYREIDRLGGHDPYSTSKAAVELLVSSYRSSYFTASEYGHLHNVALSTARAGNVIGGGDWAENRLLPDIIRAWNDGKTAIIRNPDAVRPWQHVLEPLSGYLVLAERLFESIVFAESWNFGPFSNGCLTVGGIVNYISNLLEDLEVELLYSENPKETNILKLDISKAVDLLGWRPRWGIEKTIEETIAMYVDLKRSKDCAFDLIIRSLNKYSEDSFLSLSTSSYNSNM